MSEITITNNSFLRQYETTVASSLAKIEYAAQERKIFLTKLIIPSEITQPGFKEDFIIAVLEDFKEQESSNNHELEKCLKPFINLYRK